MINVLLSTGVVLFAFLLTWQLRLYALSRSVMDIPNARSSHTVATARGGGVAIVIVFLLSLLIMWFKQDITLSVMLALLGGGGFIAVIGFIDDHGHIAARWRLLGHFSAAAWGIFWLGGMAPVVLFGLRLDVQWVIVVLGALYLVWMLNLYNFMDGIDGIASVEAITVCLSACAIYWFMGYFDLILPPMMLALATVGFLLWNFPPARIFMGDAGSGFIGFMLGLLSLVAARTALELLWVWLILLGVFIVDATFTLGRRLSRGERVYEAHRSHAYQFASRKVGKHLPVTVAVGLINIFWLLPIAACVAIFNIDGGVGVIVAYVPLIALAIRFQAGARES
ncbi:glycosyltransferase family 4 protein [Pseudomonas sp.]|jgi:Fuc2NAc and GlcNAc transferase|uniref:MraY family glycosyltransferase n=1 Tax=Pseudomonas sp. TaxID=306 RepID=UPI002589A157|nr:glycosyltransferase family 4 protein [Pseudomonas sp.]